MRSWPLDTFSDVPQEREADERKLAGQIETPVDRPRLWCPPVRTANRHACQSMSSIDLAFLVTTLGSDPTVAPPYGRRRPARSWRGHAQGNNRRASTATPPTPTRDHATANVRITPTNAFRVARPPCSFRA